MDNRTFLLSRTTFIAILLLVVTAFGGVALVRNGRQEHLRLKVTNTADTAKVYSVVPSTGLDSFYYSDTFVITATDSTVVTFASPPTVRRVAVAATIDTGYTDSITIDLGTNATVLSFAVSDTTWTRARYIDTIVARINGLAATSDTVLAQDSGTYIKLVGLIPQIGLEGDARWTLAFSADSNNMSESDSTFTSVADVVTGIVAAINGTAALADSLTAANSGDTLYTVTGRKGYDFLLSPGDTTQDTTVATAAVAGISSVTDTIFLEHVAGDDRNFTSLYLRAILRLSDDTLHGIGDSSPAFLYLLNGFDSSYFAWAAAADSSELPCTLLFKFPDAAAADTVFKQKLYLIAKVTDTFSDTDSYMIEYDIDLDYTLKGPR